MDVESIIQAILAENCKLADYVNLEKPLETAQMMQNILYVLQDFNSLERLGIQVSQLVFNKDYWEIIKAAQTAVKLAMGVYITEELLAEAE